MKVTLVACIALLVSGCQSADERKIQDMVERRVAQTNFQIADLGKPYIFRAAGDARMACLTVKLKNQWGEVQPPQRVIAWYIPRVDDWFTDNFRPADDGLTCEQYVDPKRLEAERKATSEKRAVGIKMPITPGVPENTGTFGPQTAAETAAAQATVDRALSKGSANLTGMTIQQCYHPDSCGTVKILSVSVIETKGSARLIKADVRFGDIADPDKPRNIRWKQTSEVYALCSTASPIVAWREGSSFLAEEFDFAGEGISGVQQNNASIYEALCHGFVNGELEARATSLGYRPLSNGGRGQFKVNSLQDLW